MRKAIIKTGDRFGRLTILNELEKQGNFRYFELQFKNNKKTGGNDT
jgi:hypothetical protein